MEGVLKLKKEIKELLVKKKRCGSRGLEPFGCRKEIKTHDTFIVGRHKDTGGTRFVS